MNLKPKKIMKISFVNVFCIGFCIVTFFCGLVFIGKLDYHKPKNCEYCDSLLTHQQFLNYDLRKLHVLDSTQLYSDSVQIEYLEGIISMYQNSK